ncbi:recombinase family protein [Lachnospiraceae bacterium 66-29]
MARTADRYLKKTVKTEAAPKIYDVGNYLRLSVDSDYTGSDSLQNQRKLAQEYVRECPDLNIVREYVDDGKTGTDFSRPAFTRMIADLKAGIINCVLVKDLSRFGREYIEAGNYIEKVFPFLGVRFISIVDKYDSAEANCSRELLLISLKNLMHEMYAKDISKKVGSTFRMKQEKGMFYRSATVPYGYKMNESGTNYIICEQTAPIVREIFKQCSQGISNYAISRWLYDNHVYTPQQYIWSGNVYKKPEEELKIWHCSTIKRILKNPVYIGRVVRHKSEQSFFVGKKASPVPEHEQIVIENNHEPIIEKPMFEIVQKILSQTKGKKTESTCERQSVVFDRNVFQGKLFCGSCKANMVRVGAYRSVNGVKEQYRIFKCSTHRNHCDLCDTRWIAEDLLCDILYGTIRKHLSLIKGIKKQIEKDIRYSFEENLKQTEWKRQKVVGTKNLLELEYMQKYSDYAEGNISQAAFLQYKSTYHEKMELYGKQENVCVKELKRTKKCQTALQKLLSDWLCFQNTRKLTETMVEICVDRIELFTDNKVEIKLKYQDCFELLENWMRKEV